MPIDVDVLIVSYHSADVLRDTVASVRRTIPGAGLAIREHGDDPRALAQLGELAATDGRIRLAHDPSNPGFAAGCNALAASSTARWLLFLNPDARILTWPWGDAEPVPAVIGPTMVDSGPEGDHWGVSYRVIDEIRRSWLRRRGPRPDGHGFVSGAAMLVPADDFRAVGGFDERYFLYYEDIDLCERLNRHGLETAVSSGWTVHHARAHSTRGQFARSLVWSYESACRFHADRGESLAAYRTYVVADSVGRGCLAAARRQPARRSAYRQLAARAARDLVRRDRVAP